MNLRVFARALAVAAVILGCTSSAAAQGGGIKFGPTFTSSADVLNYKNRTGIHAGLLAATATACWACNRSSTGFERGANPIPARSSSNRLPPGARYAAPQSAAVRRADPSCTVLPALP